MDPRKLSLQALLSYCLETQDPDAWAELERRTQRLIAGVIYRCVSRRIGPKPDLVDDLVQNTYLKLCDNNFKALRDFDFQHENAFFAFLKVVASRVVEDYFRTVHSKKQDEGREKENIDDAKIPAPFRPNSLSPAEMDILMDQIDRCLAQLASEPNFARDRAIFWLYYRYGLTAKAISQLPGITLTVKGVESTLLRLTRYVKVCLNPPPPSQKRATIGR